MAFWSKYLVHYSTHFGKSIGTCDRSKHINAITCTLLKKQLLTKSFSGDIFKISK